MANNRFIRNIKIEADTQGNLPKSIQLLHVGSWNTPWHGDFELTEGDIQSFAENFKAGVGLPEDSDGKAPVNYSHRSGEKAAGWLSNVRAEYVDSVLSLLADVEWTPNGAKALADQEFRYISPEFNPRALPWEDPEEEWRMVANVFTGAGLTNIPLFKKLKKVAASERPDSSNKPNQGEPMKFKLEEVRIMKASDLSADQKAFLETNKKELTDAELTAFDIKADSASKPKPVAKPVAAAVEGQVSIPADELAQLKADAQQGVAAAQQLACNEANAFASARISAGQIKSDQKDTLVSILLASKGDTRKDLETFVQGLPENKLITAGELGSGEGGEGATASEQLMVKANKVVADSNGSVTLANAMKQVLASDADLREQVNAERK